MLLIQAADMYALDAWPQPPLISYNESLLGIFSIMQQGSDFLSSFSSPFLAGLWRKSPLWGLTKPKGQRGTAPESSEGLSFSHSSQLSLTGPCLPLNLPLPWASLFASRTLQAPSPLEVLARLDPSTWCSHCLS